MKAMICEKCGSQLLDKFGDGYKCRYCGTCYTEEQAKVMTVEVAGAVRIDNTGVLQRALLNARRAMQKADWEETERYYNIVEENDPHHIEAIFYSSYAKAKRSLVEGDIFKRQAVFETLRKTVSILDDNYDIRREKEFRSIIGQIGGSIDAMEKSDFVFHPNAPQNEFAMTRRMFRELNGEFAVTLRNIINKFPNTISDRRDIAYMYAMLGNLYHKLGNQKAAAAAYDVYVKLRPGTKVPYTTKSLEEREAKEKRRKRIIIAVGCTAAFFGLIALTVLAFIYISAHLF